MIADLTVTRFAPSPNGPLHLGHAYSAIIAHDLAEEAGGKFLLRIEDIDGPRSHPELADEFRRDLEWLGLEWKEVPAQSTRLESYERAVDLLRAAGMLYRCTCSRTDIRRAQAEAGITDGRYPGTCKNRDLCENAGEFAWRLDAQRAFEQTQVCEWQDTLSGSQLIASGTIDDAVIMRKDAPASYHLAVTLDDAADGITLVTRGQDLFGFTAIHRLLQALLELPVPLWHHHPLLFDGTGEKLAKRRGSPSLADRRRSGENGRALAERLRGEDFPAGISLRSS
ncbi:tRNA glutamyl-Q(34) synthetase GluQRS [Sphingomonadaceae bacterium]|nr:tRNA glutamyl-Q(34) synthetase GluQRS [Sphingomonadaceae bacterium]